MSTTAVLLCRELGLEQGSVAGALPDGTPLAVVDDLCHRPYAAGKALRGLEATRVVLGLCGERPSAELVGALRSAGAESFGIEPVLLEGRPLEEAQVLLRATVAKLRMLAHGEHGKPMLAAGGMSRRALFSPRALLTEAPVALLNADACLGSSGCGLCISRCPTEAISAAERGNPAIDEAACTACGACVTSCPTNALRLSGCSTAQIEAQLGQLVGQLPGVLFACPSAAAVPPPGWALIELPTLALLTPGWILQLRARGVQVKLARCDQECCVGTHDVEALAELITFAGSPAASSVVTPLSLAEPAATVDAVLAIMSEWEPIRIEHSAAPLGMLELDNERCTVCGACALACPTSALRFDEEAAQAMLHHAPRACVACDRCTTVCPEDAVAVRRGIDLGRLRAGTVDIASSARQRCLVCGTDLPPAPMRRRLRELLPEIAQAPLELCTGCAMRAARRTGGSNREDAGSTHAITC
jgi:ferredoxin